MIDQGLIMPLTLPITMNVVSEKLGGDVVTPNKQGFYPNWSGYVYTHLTKN
jgi:peptide/nickel transport system substrate-binding protein/oligopeptide transport system substrate-binding protein